MDTFKAVTGYAIQATAACRPLTLETIDKAIDEGNALLVPGVDLEDALEVEHALRLIKALRTYRVAIEEVPER